MDNTNKVIAEKKHMAILTLFPYFFIGLTILFSTINPFSSLIWVSTPFLAIGIYLLILYIKTPSVIITSRDDRLIYKNGIELHLNEIKKIDVYQAGYRRLIRDYGDLTIYTKDKKFICRYVDKPYEVKLSIKRMKKNIRKGI